MTDTVLQPEHYIQGSHECIDEIKAMLTPDEFRGFLKGNIIKYRYRANLKNGKEDLEKADNYAYYLINGRFETEADLEDRKDDIAFNTLNALIQQTAIAQAVCTLLNENYLSPNTLKTKQKIYSLIDKTKTRLLNNTDSIDSLYNVHFTDGSKMELLIENGASLKVFLTTKCFCRAKVANFII